MNLLKLPLGVSDVLVDECAEKNAVESALCKCFSSFGFFKIETPSLEFYDLYNSFGSNETLNKMFKFTDSDGRLLVLRPDPTLQICRLSATKLSKDAPQKLYYCLNSFEYLSKTAAARTREFSQAGVEFLGESSVESDIEIILLAITALKSAGLKDFIIEIGDAGYCEGLLEQSGLSNTDKKILSEFINSKDMLSIEIFLKNKNADKQFISKLLSLRELFGDVSVLDKALKVCSNEKSAKAVSRLRTIYQAFLKAGLEKYLSIEMGLVSSQNYYSGLIMRGACKSLGLSILDGGRYDKLSKEFNGKGAIGFSIGIKRLLMALESEGKKSESAKPCDYAYISKANLNNELQAVTDLRKKYRVVKCFFESKQELVAYCVNNGIKNAFIIYDDKTETVLDANGGK